MSPQSNPRTKHQSDSDRAQAAVGVRPPTVELPRSRTDTFRRGQRAGRMRMRYLLGRAQRPIRDFLVTHRTRFTTGNKHGKHPDQGQTPS